MGRGIKPPAAMLAKATLIVSLVSSDVRLLRAAVNHILVAGNIASYASLIAEMVAGTAFSRRFAEAPPFYMQNGKINFEPQWATVNELPYRQQSPSSHCHRWPGMASEVAR